MRTFLFSIVALGVCGTAALESAHAENNYPADVVPASVVDASEVVQAGFHKHAGCNSCGGGRAVVDKNLSRVGSRIDRATSNYHSTNGMMPQTCYHPRYGCYYGGGRHMHRHTAFQGTYYRAPYNYRHYFQYPWHAEQHEPTSLYSYNVEREYEVDRVPAGNQDVPPPLPQTASNRRAPIR